jgi:hypothetical protein
MSVGAVNHAMDRDRSALLQHRVIGRCNKISALAGIVACVATANTANVICSRRGFPWRELQSCLPRGAGPPPSRQSWRFSDKISQNERFVMSFKLLFYLGIL